MTYKQLFMAVCKHVILVWSVCYHLVEAQGMMQCSCSEIHNTMMGLSGSAMGESGDDMLNVTGMYITLIL